MWWWVGGGLGVLLWFMLLLIFGLGCIQKSRWLWFVLGIFLPLFWIIGFLIPSRQPQAT
jgi:hypothetical protein